jgi:hypothetical protein
MVPRVPQLLLLMLAPVHAALMLMAIGMLAVGAWPLAWVPLVPMAASLVLLYHVAALLRERRGVAVRSVFGPWTIAAYAAVVAVSALSLPTLLEARPWT